MDELFQELAVEITKGVVTQGVKEYCKYKKEKKEAKAREREDSLQDQAIRPYRNYPASAPLPAQYVQKPTYRTPPPRPPPTYLYARPPPVRYPPAAPFPNYLTLHYLHLLHNAKTIPYNQRHTIHSINHHLQLFHNTTTLPLTSDHHLELFHIPKRSLLPAPTTCNCSTIPKLPSTITCKCSAIIRVRPSLHIGQNESLP